MADKPFWLVWNPATKYAAHRHSDYPSAKAEALRLARLHPGQEFFILGTHGRIVKTDVHVDEWGMAELFTDEIPF